MSYADTSGTRPAVTIVSARCSHTGRLFGIRFERMGETWVGTWAFAIKEERASREGYDRNEIRGQFAFDENYPGCPYCEEQSLVQCSCGKAACYDGKAKKVKCPWCRTQGVIEGSVDRLSGGRDR